MEELLSSLITLPFIKKGEGKKPAASEGAEKMEPADSCADEKEELAECRLRAEIYKAMLLRYQVLIEQGESRSVVELKGMVNPHDEALAGMHEEIVSSFHPYIYDENFLAAFEAALAKLKGIKTVKLPLDFWLSFSEMLSLGAADEMDKAIMLCSLLRKLDSGEAWVLITESRKPYVIFEFSGDSYAVDAGSCKWEKGATREEALKKLSENSKPLYAFNDRSYEEYGEL